jgi:septum formation protein
MPEETGRHQQRRIILASSSPRRRELLLLTGLRFEVDAGDYEERMDLDIPPHRLATLLAREKARTVACRYSDAIVIAADTFILHRGKLLGKPHTQEEARRMLMSLNGRTHSVITGFAIIDTGSGKKFSKAVETKVSFRRLTRDEIDSYVRTKEPLDKAGAYAIQGLGSVFITKVEGDYFNVIGLPLCDLVKALGRFRVSVL